MDRNDTHHEPDSDNDDAGGDAPLVVRDAFAGRGGADNDDDAGGDAPPAGQSPRLEELLRREHSPAYGQVVRLSPLVQRVTAANAGPFTFAGTGTYIVGKRRVAVIDPGPDDADHVEALLRALEGREVTHICVTHTHSDHSPATRALAAATGAPILGYGPHPAADTHRGGALQRPTEGGETADEEPGDWDFVPEARLMHGELIVGDGWTLECLHTPGHISNHLCFAVVEDAGVLTGDHVMGWSSTIIPPPDGNLADYLQSLQLLIDRGGRDRVYWPTHGPPIDSPSRFVRALLAHRHSRTAQILACLRDGPVAIPALVARMYTATPKMLHRAAERSVLAHLIHLGRQGQVADDGDADDRTRVYSLA